MHSSLHISVSLTKNPEKHREAGLTNNITHSSVSIWFFTEKSLPTLDKSFHVLFPSGTESHLGHLEVVPLCGKPVLELAGA